MTGRHGGAPMPARHARRHPAAARLLALLVFGLVVDGSAWAASLALDHQDAVHDRTQKAVDSAQGRVLADRRSQVQDAEFQRKSLAARHRDDSVRAIRERAAAQERRSAAVAAGRAAVESSAGRADDVLRQELASAIDALEAAPFAASALTRHGPRVDELTKKVAVAVEAWQTEQERLAAAAREKASADTARARAATQQDTVDVAPRPAVGDGPLAVAEQTLRSLPGSSGVSIVWGHPDIGGSLGGVHMGTSVIMLNDRRLTATPGRIPDVIRHELAHVYQGRAWKSSGLPWSEVEARMDAAFGGRGMEFSADCVALRLGASWTHYTSTCGGAEKQAWVDALLAGRLP